MNKIANNTPAFGSKYHLKGGIHELNELRQNIIPSFRLVSNSPVFALSTDEYFKMPIKQTVTRLAKSTGQGGPEWLVQNVKRNYGIELNIKDRNDIFVFTGEDTNKLAKFMKKRRLATSIGLHFNTLKNAVGGFLNNLPQHVIAMKQISSFVQNEEKLFYKFAGNDCKKVKDTQDLVKTILNDEYK